MGDLVFHDVAEIFPLMDPRALSELAADIATNGLREPIWLDVDGRVIDGRNRYRACQQAGVTPTFRTWNGNGSIVGFVVSLNLHRRQLSKSQRGLVAARLATLQRGRPELNPSHDGFIPTEDDARRLLGVGESLVQRGKVAIAHGVPELIAAVERDEVTVSAAATVSRLSVDEQRELVARGPRAVAHAAESLRRAPLADDAAPPSAPVVDKSRAGMAKRVERIRQWATEGHTTREIAGMLGISPTAVNRIAHDHAIDLPANRIMGRLRRHDSNRIAEQIVIEAVSLTDDVNLITFSKLDRARLAGWIGDLLHASKALHGFIRQMRKEQERDETGRVQSRSTATASLESV